MAQVILAAIVGYLIGAISPATLIARARGVDLRAIGSGNPGASNAGRALGRRTGALVALLDVAKGAVPAAVFASQGHDAGLVAGLAAVIGHITSPYLRGRGGKGVATAAGAILGIHPLWLLGVLAVWGGVLGVSRWIALASICAGFTVLFIALALGEDQLWATAVALLVVGRHVGNVRARLRPQGA